MGDTRKHKYDRWKRARNKRGYTCVAWHRDEAMTGCRKFIKAEMGDHKTLKKAGWKHNGNSSRDHWKCPACAAK